MALPLVVPAGITAARVAAPYVASLVRQYGPKVLGALTGASLGDKFIDIGQLEKDKDIEKLPPSVKTETEKDFKIPPFMGVIPSVVDLIEGFSQTDSKPKEKGFVQEEMPDMSILAQEAIESATKKTASEGFLKATKANTPLNNALKEIGEERLSQMTVKEAAELIEERYPNINKSNLKGNLYDKNLNFKSTELRGDLKKNAISALDELGQNQFFKITADDSAFTKGKFSNEEITNYLASKNINLSEFQVGKVVEEFIKNAHTKAIKKNASKEFLEKTKTPNPVNIALREIGEKKIKKLTNPELTKLLKEDYNLNLYDSQITIKKLDTVSYRGDQAKDKVKNVLNSIKDIQKYSFDELLELPKVKKIIEQEGISRQYFKQIKSEMGIVQDVTLKVRKPLSSLLKEFDEADQVIINNFNDELKKITGFNESSALLRISGPMNRFLNAALEQGASNKQIIEQLSKIDKKALADVLVKNSKIRNKLKRANELGIDLDDLNLSHMQDVADNWRTTLDANNLFLATREANQVIQKKLDKSLKKIFENFREAKTISEKKEIVKEFKNIKKELIDNDLVSIIDGKKVGADVDFEKTFKKFSEKADAAILERLFKKDGGIISMEEMIKRPIYERY